MCFYVVQNRPRSTGQRTQLKKIELLVAHLPMSGELGTLTEKVLGGRQGGRRLLEICTLWVQPGPVSENFLLFAGPLQRDFSDRNSCTMLVLVLLLLLMLLS